MTTLTICALAHNNESVLSRFFTCIEGLDINVLIGDLGSTDATCMIAEKQGASVVKIPFAQDYSAARNLLLDRVTTPWTLILDCHETISNPSLRRLLGFIESTDHDVFILPVHNYSNESNLMGWKPSDLEGYKGYVPTKQARLFRNNTAIRYQYPVHETILPSVNGTSLVVKEITDITIHNHNYSVQLEQFFGILKKQHAANPEDIHTTYDLGLAYLRKGRLQAAKKLFTEIAAKFPQYKNTLTNLATITLKMGDHFTAAKIFLQAIEQNPKDLNAYHNLGQLFWQNKQYDKAEYLFKKALTTAPREPRLIIALSKVYQDTGKQDKAKELLERSLTLLPKNKMILDALSTLN